MVSMKGIANPGNKNIPGSGKPEASLDILGRTRYSPNMKTLYVLFCEILHQKHNFLGKE